MSKKLKKAMMANKVSVRNKTGSEAMAWYRGRDLKRYTCVLQPNATTELVPKLTDAPLLQWSNLEDLVKRGIIEII